MYAFSSKSGSEPFRALGDLTWNDPTTLKFRYPPLSPYLCTTVFIKMIDNHDRSMFMVHYPIRHFCWWLPKLKVSIAV